MTLWGKAKLGIGLCAATILLVTGAALWSSNITPKTSPEACALDHSNLGAFIDIPGGGFVLGAEPLYPSEGPPKKVFVSPFRLHTHEVTNSQFATFVQATGYVTEAERNGGSAQFSNSNRPEVFLSWWSIDSGATWRTPEGIGSTLQGRALHPVVHVTLNDARAYAQWAGGRIPTEVEWEYAASLGLFDPQDPESGVRHPDGRLRANVWTGVFRGSVSPLTTPSNKGASWWAFSTVAVYRTKICTLFSFLA